MPEIPLTQGMVAVVDQEDYASLNQRKWYVLKVEKLCYAVRSVKGGVVLMHRQLLNVTQGKEIDHKDGDGLNNCRSNLRTCNHQQNHYNLRNRLNTSSIYKGVSWDKDKHKWRASLKAEGKIKHLGRFKDEALAALAYNEAATKYHGEYARLNIIQPCQHGNSPKEGE